MLKGLIEDAVKDGKMSAMDAVDMMCKKLPECDRRELYRKVYEVAYGSRLNERAARDWVDSMRVAPWSEAETYAAGSKAGVDWGRVGRWEWYAVMNMMRGDHARTAQAYGEDSPEFYARLARDFIEDDDGPEDKVFRYYTAMF